MIKIIKHNPLANKYFSIGLILPLILCPIFVLSIVLININFDVDLDLYFIKIVWICLSIIYLSTLINFYLGFRAMGRQFFTALAFAFWLAIGYSCLSVVSELFVLAVIFRMPTS